MTSVRKALGCVRGSFLWRGDDSPPTWKRAIGDCAPVAGGAARRLLAGMWEERMLLLELLGGLLEGLVLGGHELVRAGLGIVVVQ